MIRIALPAAIGLVIIIAAAMILRAPAALPAKFGPEDCRVIDLVESGGDGAITGIEDLLLLPDGDTLILSALDRRDPAGPDGGLYSVSMAELGGPSQLTAKRLDSPRESPFRPHGIAVNADGSRLAVINHDSDNAGSVEIGALGAEAWHPEREITDPRFCRSNDLIFGEAGEETLRVTIDRADCQTSIRDLIGGTGSIALTRGDGVEIEQEGLNFPNGIVEGWVAETRARRLSGGTGQIDLPGGPDNLDFRDGRITAALHPHLLRTGLFIAGWWPRAGSRIASIDPGGGEVEILFDDPEGRRFAGATAAVFADGRLVAGAARDAGLLYCESPE